MLGYNWNIMWLDCIFILPLIMLGLEKLMRDGKGLMYGVESRSVHHMQLLYIHYGMFVSCIVFFYPFYSKKDKNMAVVYKQGL